MPLTVKPIRVPWLDIEDVATEGARLFVDRGSDEVLGFPLVYVGRRAPQLLRDIYDRLNAANGYRRFDPSWPNLSESIEGGGEVSPQAFNEMGKRFDSGDIDVLAYNTQTESPQTERIRKQADAANVAVVDFTETLPANTDYVAWMESNIQAMEELAK